jgi:hypothetical protein
VWQITARQFFGVNFVVETLKKTVEQFVVFFGGQCLGGTTAVSMSLPMMSAH